MSAMGGLFAAQAGASLIQGEAEAGAAREAGRFAEQQGEQNARLLEAQAERTEQQGGKEAGLFRRKVRGVIGSQRAALAAQGLDVGSGTALDLQEETAKFGEIDATQIRKNAIRSAFGLRSEAGNARDQGQLGRITGRSRAASALLTGGINALGSGARAYEAFGAADTKPKAIKTTNKRTSAGSSGRDRSGLA